MLLATNYRKDISRSHPFPYSSPIPSSFCHGLSDSRRKKKTRGSGGRASTGKYFHRYKFVFAIFFEIERLMLRRPLNYELDPNQLQSSQTLSFSSQPFLAPSEIMLLMKRNDQLGVSSFRQTSFIDLLPPTCLETRIPLILNGTFPIKF